MGHRWASPKHLSSLSPLGKGRAGSRLWLGLAVERCCGSCTGQRAGAADPRSPWLSRSVQKRDRGQEWGRPRSSPRPRPLPAAGAPRPPGARRGRGRCRCRRRRAGVAVRGTDMQAARAGAGRPGREGRGLECERERPPGAGVAMPLGPLCAWPPRAALRLWLGCVCFALVQAGKGARGGDGRRGYSLPSYAATGEFSVPFPLPEDLLCPLLPTLLARPQRLRTFLTPRPVLQPLNLFPGILGS